MLYAFGGPASVAAAVWRLDGALDLGGILVGNMGGYARRGVEMTNTSDELGTIVVKIAQIMIDELKIEDLSAETFDPEMDLVDELGIDSMDLTTVVLVLQDAFEIVIEEDDYPTLSNLRKMAEYVVKKRG